MSTVVMSNFPEVLEAGHHVGLEVVPSQAELLLLIHLLASQTDISSRSLTGFIVGQTVLRLRRHVRNAAPSFKSEMRNGGTHD